MTQRVSGPRFPYLPVLIRIGPAPAIEQALELEPLVDTGFDGGVAVPEDLLDPSLTPYSHSIWRLADGTEILTPAYLGSVQIGNLQPVPAVIIALGDEALLGRDVTNRFRLIFDHGQRVIVEP